MRLPKGTKVEVWIADAATNMGAWRAGEVIDGNGHKYDIKWFDAGPDPGRIMRKFVRPRPEPDLQLPKDVAPGDIVELFDSNLWKLVEVVRVDDHQFDVKFFGYTNILTVDVSVLRPRLIYGEEGWSLIHKNSKIPIESPIPSRPIAGKKIKSKATGNGIGNVGSNFAAQAVKPGKKRSNCTVDSNIVRDFKRFQGDTDRLFAKRDEPVARYNDNIEVMDVHPSHYLKKREGTGNNVDFCLARITDSHNHKDDGASKSDTLSSTSDTSTSDSSGSSGSNGKGGDCATSATVQHSQKHQEADIQLLRRRNKVEQDSDNRTLQHHRSNEVQGSIQQEGQHDGSLHVLELDAYVSVMKAFHATGLLTWFKEKLLTDLRLHLNISSDEHLQVIWLLNGKKKPAGGPRNDNSVCH
ncbi:hypothetical protein ACQ4PT_006925 [Festuca glaucescens]